MIEHFPPIQASPLQYCVLSRTPIESEQSARLGRLLINNWKKANYYATYLLINTYINLLSMYV